jgi:membrane-associated HD superfamily phosphohydrolase
MLDILNNRNRNTELLLILVNSVIAFFAYQLVQINTDATNSLSLALIITVIFAVLLVHLVIRFAAAEADPYILPTALFLNLLGIVMIHRLDTAEIIRNPETGLASAEAPSQIVWMLVGLTALSVGLFVVKDHRRLQRHLGGRCSGRP